MKDGYYALNKINYQNELFCCVGTVESSTKHGFF